MGRSRRSAPAPSRNLPARAPAPAPPAPVMQQPQQPGLMAQMASTAAGVAVGSAVGHTVGAMITGGMGGGHQPQAQEPAPVQQQYQQPPQQQQQQNPCFEQLQQFIQCSTTQSDLTMCTGFNDALKDCKMRYGL